MRKRITMMSPMSGEGDFLSQEIEEAAERTETELKIPPEMSTNNGVKDKKLNSTKAVKEITISL